MKTPLPSPIANARRAFTLIELLTVIAIIGILAGILIPTISAVRQTARASACASNLRQIATATLTFAIDNKDRLLGEGTPPNNDLGRGWMGGWPWVLNATMFDAKSIQWTVPYSTAHYRTMMGSPKGSLYCPTSGSDGGTDYRSYLMNEYTKAGQYGGWPKPAGNETTMTTQGVDWVWDRGVPINQFGGSLSQKVLFLESERTNPWATSYNGFGAFTVENNSAIAPWPIGSDTGTRYAFRHKGRMNVAFMDGHVKSFNAQQTEELINKPERWRLD